MKESFIKIQGGEFVSLWLKLLLVSAMLNVSSCSTELDNPQADLNEYGINTSANREAILDLLDNRELLREIYLENLRDLMELLRPTGKGSSSDHEPITFEELMTEYETCGDCSVGHKDVMVPMLMELSEASNSEVISTITKYEEQIARQDQLSDQEKSDLYFLTFVQGCNRILFQGGSCS